MESSAWGSHAPEARLAASPRRRRMEVRLQTPREEIANSIIHGVALVASIAALPVLVLSAASRRDPWQIVGGAVFGVTLVLLYLASTLRSEERRVGKECRSRWSAY